MTFDFRGQDVIQNEPGLQGCRNPGGIFPGFSQLISWEAEGNFPNEEGIMKEQMFYFAGILKELLWREWPKFLRSKLDRIFLVQQWNFSSTVNETFLWCRLPKKERRKEVFKMLVWYFRNEEKTCKKCTIYLNLSRRLCSKGATVLTTWWSKPKMFWFTFIKNVLRSFRFISCTFGTFQKALIWTNQNVSKKTVI